MPSFYDVLYATGLVVASPVLLAKSKLRNKVRHAFAHRDGRVAPRQGGRPCVLIHGVSVGEVNAARPLVERLTPHAQIAVASTTETGYERATSLFGTDTATDVFATRFPIDYSRAVGRLLDAIRPNVLASMELELWPNLVRVCRKRGVPVVVVNGRITTSSFRQYRRLLPLLKPMFRGATGVLAQDETYADRFRQLGVPSDKVRVIGSLKFDAAPTSTDVDGVDTFAQELGLNSRRLGGTEPTLVAGSTGPGEETIVLDAFDRLRRDVPGLRLVIVPRHPPRFDEVAGLIRRRHPLTRRTGETVEGGVVLVDTMGELRKAWRLADVAVIGRTLVDLGPRQHGSDLLEPAALGSPVVTGPFFANFDAPTRALLNAGGAVLAAEADQLIEHTRHLLSDPDTAATQSQAARHTIDTHRGVADETVRYLLDVMENATETPRQGLKP